MNKIRVFIFIIVLCGCSSADRNNNHITMVGDVSMEESGAAILSPIIQPNEPGLQYIIVNKDKTLFKASGGLADIKNGDELTQQHTMAAFSMTKTLTAIAVLQLTAQNKIHLDNSVSDYIEQPYGEDISIWQLLNHTSGIPNPIPLKWVHLEQEQSQFDEALALTKILRENPNVDSQPGEKYRYSNIGYWLLGKVIEKVSGQSYIGYIQSNIFDVIALSADEIGFRTHNKALHAKGYLKKWSLMNIFGRFFIEKKLLGEYEGEWLHIHNVYVNGPAFGGAIGSATAFTKILQDLLSEDSKLLDKQSKTLLYRQQKTHSGENINMTLGWHINHLNGFTYYYKEGGGAGFHAEMRIYPDKGLASVIMTNKTTFDSQKILSELDSNFIKTEK